MCSMPGQRDVVEVVALARDEAVVLVALDASGRCRRSRRCRRPASRVMRASAQAVAMRGRVPRIALTMFM